MKFLSTFFSFLLLSNLSAAQSFKILKIQGNKAIVQIDQPEMVELNQTYNTGQSLSKNKSFGTGYKRDNAIDLSFSFSSLKANTPGATANDILSLTGTYLWNFKVFEVGPILGFSSSKSGTTTITTTYFGGVGFYNFNENKPGVEGVFSLYGSLALGNTSGGTSSSSETAIQVGPNYRWFILSGDHCIGASAVYHYSKGSSSGVDITTTGFRVLGSISTYF